MYVTCRSPLDCLTISLESFRLVNGGPKYLQVCHLVLMTGTILSITVPALYNQYEEHIDKYCGMIHRKLSHHYKIVDESVISRIPRSLSKDKDA